MNVMHDVNCAKASDHSKACNCALAPNYAKSPEAVNHPAHYAATPSTRSSLAELGETERNASGHRSTGRV